MASRRNRRGTERAATDRSLRAERTKTDAELTKRGGSVEKRAAAVVTLARERADAVVARTRERHDAKMVAEGAGDRARATVAKERARADAVLLQERAAESRTIARERVASRRLMDRLLGHERAVTDQRLSLERASADHLIGSRDDFFAVVSHEVGTLVGGLMLSAASLPKASRDAKAQRAIDAHVKLVAGTTAALRRLASDLIDSAAIEAGSFTIVATPQRLDTLARLTSGLFDVEAAAKQITIRKRLPRRSVIVRCDPDRILQVLANVVRNAVQATPPRGVVEIRVEALRTLVRFTVSDTGPGMDRLQLAHAFDRGWRGPGQGRRGLGLGLYISRGIVEAHGGTIHLATRRRKGTTVDFTLPIERHATAT